MRAEELIRTLDLQPHPEGGFYREVHRSPSSTAIYFLLLAGQFSRWHRVDAEEVWHHYEGGPLELVLETGEIVLGPDRRVAVVPAGAWQAARPLGDYALMGCAVAPPFRFEGFALLRDVRDEADRLKDRRPELL
jgi:predicted cupin superfamily sugar epimerase